MILKYTYSLNFWTTLALKNSNRDTAMFVLAKEALVQRSAFPKLPTTLTKYSATAPQSAHNKLNEKFVYQTLIT